MHLMHLDHRTGLPLSFDESFFHPILHAGQNKRSAGLLSDNRFLYREVIRARGSLIQFRTLII